MFNLLLIMLNKILTYVCINYFDNTKNKMKKTVLITGGTGFIGRYLIKILTEKGYAINVLTRTHKKNTATVSYYTWDIASGSIEEKAVLDADYIIHLAGESIAEKRWTVERKKAILDSRVQSTALLASVLQSNKNNVKAFISASGIGIYGALNGEGICTETSPAAHDFLGKVCLEWEKAVDTIAPLGIRTVKVRTGLVLGESAGFLQKMANMFTSKSSGMTKDEQDMVLQGFNTLNEKAESNAETTAQIAESVTQLTATVSQLNQNFASLQTKLSTEPVPMTVTPPAGVSHALADC